MCQEEQQGPLTAAQPAAYVRSDALNPGPALADTQERPLRSSDVYPALKAKGPGKGHPMLHIHEGGLTGHAQRPGHISSRAETQKQRLWSEYEWAFRDLPGGPVVKKLPCNAGDKGSIPRRWSKISHAAEQLSLRATTTEPACHSKDSG